MENWQRELLEIVETVTEAVEQCFQEFGQAIEAIAEQVEVEIIAEIEYFTEEFWESPRETPDGYLEEIEFFQDFFSEPNTFVNPKIEPTGETHPACIDCCHYHGRSYSGNLLVCAMHPYGWDEPDCPDWQK